MKVPKIKLTKVYEPKKIDDRKKIDTYLKRQKRVIVNLKYLESKDGQSVIDYLASTIFAYDGKMQKIAVNTFEFVI